MKSGNRTAAIVLAGGAGRRMGGGVKKQYLPLLGKPLIYYALDAFEESFVDEIILVAAPGETGYCRKEIVDKYHFGKVSRIVEGGRERYHSVFHGIEAVEACDYLFIHDGARPLVSGEILERALEAVREHPACVVGMPVKDTIRIADESGYAVQTPRRDRIWMIQTPQVFSYTLIKEAYHKLMQQEKELLSQRVLITDDAMVAEALLGQPVKLVYGSHENIKITTPEDLLIAESLLSSAKKNNMTKGNKL